ncbi:MAG TPA: hypothetical protein VGR32_12385 [Brevundimonas sp.]|jgi:hypothetical protein|uniref:hypothetical protein n=1 Tax=Brevundimonas sp. TaxID=1871086 RepID=UPI002DE70999|nr:hypothetical protein [Brevundimonas sp.]
MTPLSDRVPHLNDDDLNVLRANAERLIVHGSMTQMTAASELLPFIDEERARRAALPPAPVVRKAPVRKKKVPPATGHQTALSG